MKRALGRFLDLSWLRAAAALAWLAVLAVLALALFLVARSCSYDFAAVGSYGVYFALHVLLPGIVVLRAVQGKPLSLTEVVALGVPTGFAIEIATFLMFSAGNAKDALRFVPVLWGVALFWQYRRTRLPPVRCRLTSRHAGAALGLAVVFLLLTVSAVSQMFAESPLAAGLPQRPIFHDWVFLVSRAAAIKQHWPLEEPSLAGTQLQYHYFMMVHAASASWVTKIELTLVLLRLMIVPLGAVLVVQVFALGRMLSRRAWGGVLAAFLTTAAGEVSFAPDYGQTMFLGLFKRWLFVSPTFFFGLVFFGALMLAVAQGFARRRVGWRHLLWILLLAVAGSGAKGTVLPVLLAALGLWAAWDWFRIRRFPVWRAAIGVVLVLGFVPVYFSMMTSWGTGEAALEPFSVFRLTEFWQTHAGPWQQWLAQWLPARGAHDLAVLACAAVVFAGTAGVRLLAFACLLHGDARHPAPLRAWLGAVFLASCAMGLLLHLDSYGELYLILLIRLPMAVLAAAFLVRMAERLREFWREAVLVAPEPGRVPPPPLIARGYGWMRARGRRGFALVATAAIGLTLAVQTSLAVTRNLAGFADWLRVRPQLRVDEPMRQLHEAMLWVRTHTEPDAVLVANTFTPPNLQQGRGSLVDRTTMGVHYYYSALSERRLWVEGPTYLRDGVRAKRRMKLAAGLFFGGAPLESSAISRAPCYVVLDHSLGDGARLTLPAQSRVFANARFEVYRLPRRLGRVGADGAAEAQQ